MSDETPTSDEPQVERIAIAVVLDRERFLVGRRPLGVSMAGFAEFPGGKIEGDETPAEAAVRECMEETGIQVTAHETLNLAYHHGTDGSSREIHFIRCKPMGRSVVKSPFEWSPLSRLSAYKFPPANAETIKILRRKADSL